VKDIVVELEGIQDRIVRLTPNTLRLVLVGKGKGPNLSEIIHLIGKEETLERINRAIEDINA
jgi:glutamyl/glutaminyl-tRNA synthetase